MDVLRCRLDGGRPRRLGRAGRVERAVLARDARAASLLPRSRCRVGFTTFPGEIFQTPRSWVEKSYPNLTYFNKVDRGGHFAAWEEPELFSSEVRAAFRPLR